MNCLKPSRGPHFVSRSAVAVRCRSSHSAAVCPNRNINIVLIDIDAVVQGLEGLSTAWAFAAASATSDIAGNPSVYTRYMQQLMPVLQQPYEAALMLRLLHDEGIVGARSTAGREGPVVGRPVRHSGSRPLLLNEILEHWVDEIKPTCLLRWSRQAGCSSSELEQQMREAFEQAQHSIEWEVLDVQQERHGSSSSDGNSSSSSSSGSGGGHSKQHRAATAAAAAVPSTTSAMLRAPTAVSKASVLCTADPAGAVPPSSSSTAAAAAGAAGAVTVVVQPYVSVVPCLQHCAAQVYVASTYPRAVTRAVLSAVQLSEGLSGSEARTAVQQQAQVLGGSLQQQQQVRALYGDSMQQCLHQLQQQQQEEESSVASDLNLLVVLSSPSKAPAQPILQVGLASKKPPPPPPPQQQQQQQWLQLQEPAFQVAEWVCKAPSLRARALSGQGLGLLSEWGFAEMLGADSSDAVMDGIAWRS